MTELPELELAAADRVLHVLSVVARAATPLTAAQLVQASGLSRSALYRQLARLKKFGLLQEQAGLYAPGPLCLQLAAGFEQSSNLVHVVRPFLEQLSQLTQESAGLIVASHAHAMCLAMAESTQSLRCSFAEGQSVPLQRGASALCLLAHLPAAQRNALLTQQHGPDGAPREQAQQQLQQIRERGYVVTVGEVDAGVWGCSAPIFGARRRAVGALSLMAPAQRAAHQQDLWIAHTLAMADRISRALDD